MHDGCFGLIRRPFAPVPQVDDYFPGSAIENARTTLTRCIERGEGTGLLVGGSGTGKTLLCLMLAQQSQHAFRVAMLPSGQLGTRRALFQAILYELGRPYRKMDENELRLAVVDDIMTGDDGARGLVLLADEAHLLSLRLLDELRLLTNLARGDQPRVRLVLAGSAALEERFADPKLDSFNQRLAARCYLDALNRTETHEYIVHQINFAGGRAAALFPDDACQAVYQATGGVPRLINQVCDHALLLAYVAGRPRVAAADVEEAWADLQQLPTPWNGETRDEAGDGVIEFGALDEGDVSELSAAATPALRISAADETDVDFDEPTQQIHRIERLLAEADDDFQPAGSIVPEIELHFEEPDHPFREEFAHEEVISDRYAAANRAAVRRPVAGSSRGYGFDEPTFPVNKTGGETTLSTVTADECDELPPAFADESADEYALDADSLRQAEAPLPPAAPPESESYDASASLDANDAPANELPPDAHDDAAVVERDSDSRQDILQPEEKTVPPERAPLRTTPGTPRPVNFRRLFAQLRRS